jgi:protein involved in polysaccharide export with SLBB domain
MRIAVLLCLLFALYPATLAQEAKSTPAPDAAPQATPAPTPAPTPDDAPKVRAYLINVGDTLDVVVARRPELGWRGQVNSEGTIPALPYLKNPIRALCRTEQEVATEIATAYSELIKNPSITVRVVEHTARPAILFGAVRTPQRFQLQRDVHLNELLFISGGVTDRASGDIQIFSPEAFSCPDTQQSEAAPDETKTPIRVIKILDLMAGKENTNPLIHPGDIVTVMVAEPVYITGGVVSPQGINFREQLTLARAIATVGGLSSNARGGEIRIYRRKEQATEQEVIKADYDAIRKQKQPDIPLKAYDIIEVPQSSYLSSRRTWQSAAQEIITDEKLSGALPLRVLN